MTLRLCNITAKLPSEGLRAWPPENRSVSPKGDRGTCLRKPGLDCYQYSNNTIILFTTRYKNDNTAFHRSSAVSGGRALWRAFCEWEIEHQVTKCCVKGLILRNWLGARDAGRLYESGYRQQRSHTKNFWGAKYFDFKRATAFCSGHSLSKHKMTRYARNLVGHGAFGPPGLAYVYKKRMKKKEQYLLDVQPSTDKKLATTQDRQTLQNSDEK